MQDRSPRAAVRRTVPGRRLSPSRGRSGKRRAGARTQCQRTRRNAGGRHGRARLLLLGQRCCLGRPRRARCDRGACFRQALAAGASCRAESPIRSLTLAQCVRRRRAGRAHDRGSRARQGRASAAGDAALERTRLREQQQASGHGDRGLKVRGCIKWAHGGSFRPVSRPIVFLSDFGYRNEWVGICHAVMNRASPESHIVDLSHGIPPLDVAGGALLLIDSLPYITEDAVVLAVVDPSVGRDRDLAVRTTDGRLFVGPANGLLARAWRISGGVDEAVSVTSPAVIIEPVSPSLHARDVLAPAAAHLAAGGALSELGSPIEKESITDLRLPEPSVEPG